MQPRQVITAPTPRGHQADAGADDDDGLAGLERLGVERRGPAEAARGRPRPGTPRRTRVAPSARSRARPASRVSRRVRLAAQPELGQPGHRVGRVVADHGVEHQVGDHVPRSQAVPHQARRVAAEAVVRSGHGDGTRVRPGTPGPPAPLGSCAVSVVLELADVTVRRGEAVLLDQVSWTVEEDERWVVLGPNGAGKTTLMQVAGARIHPSSGTAAILDEPWARSTSSSCAPASA